MTFDELSPLMVRTTSWLPSPFRSPTVQPRTPDPMASGRGPTFGPARTAAGAEVASVAWRKSTAPGLNPGRYSPVKAFTDPWLRFPPLPPFVRRGSVAGLPAFAAMRVAKPKV